MSLNGLILPPGVYCVDTDFTLSGTLTLNALGDPNAVWIFRAGRDFIVSGGAAANVAFLGGVGSACNVWWRLARTSTFDALSTAVGNILADTSITFAAGASLNGRALARTAEVTLSGTAISGPTCAAPPVSGSGVANYRVIKHVVNANGGTAIASNFNVHVISTENFGTADVTGSPAAGMEAPGTLYVLPKGTYAVREDVNPAYTVSYSGDCDAAGNINLYAGNTRTCTITNTHIAAPVPPLIDIVKIPVPLALPLGPGPVTYNYTVTNVGTVPMTDVSLAGDSCSPIVLNSGDTNGDQKLDVTETWKYTCTTTLSATHTNTVTATGHANGFTATHIAQATVVVGIPLVPPLIHIIKIPDPLTLPAGGGAVTYRYTVTNPGVTPLSDVGVTDDKCTGLPSRVTGHPGDLNKNDLLEPSERWSFTCLSNLTATTTNTATATGHANGFTVTDIAVATVVVAPTPPPPVILPATGVGPESNNMPWNVVAAIVAIASLALLYAARRRQA